MERVLFVCTGNTCRSPMAEALLKNKTKDIEVRSAGIHAFPGCSASLNAIEALKSKGISLEHESQPLSQELLEWSSVILTMTNQHKQVILNSLPELKDKICTLFEFANENGMNADINDPFGGSLEVYQATAEEIEHLLEKIIEKRNEP